MNDDDSQGRRKEPVERSGWVSGALIGVVAALFSLGLAELIAGLSSDMRSPVLDVGDRVIDLVPSPVKELAIDLFGTADKAVLLGGIMMILLGYAAGVGIITVRRSRALGLAGIALFGVIGTVSGAVGAAGPPGAIPSVIGAVGGGASLLLLSGRAPDGAPTGDPHFGASRRSFLFASGAVLGSALAVGGLGRLLDRRFDVATSRAVLELPAADRPLPAIPAGTSFGEIDGLTPFITPNSDFYRIDTALTVPRIQADTYTLRITGMVDKPMELSYRDLLERELIESDITMTCVSNEVGGKLAGNARWLGARLDSLLDEAGIQAGADQIVGRSVDRYTCGFPVSALDGRDAMVALAMNGEPLPIEHGFPARLVVPRALRVRVGHEVARGDRAHDLCRLRSLLGASGLGGEGSDQDTIENRHSSPVGTDSVRAHSRGRCGLGADPRDRQGRDQDR